MAERSGRPWRSLAAVAVVLAVALLVVLRVTGDDGGPGPGRDGGTAGGDDGHEGGRDGTNHPPMTGRDVPPSGTGTSRTTPTTPGTTATTAPPSPPAGSGGSDAGEGAPEMTDPGGRWRPTKGMTWQWQLDGGPIDMSVEADVYDVDLFSTTAEEVAALHHRGRRVICYFSAGSWEPYRPDAGDYPASVIGGPVEGWPDERWLDIRRLDVLRPLIAARLDLCAAKGADGAEPDWMDNHTQDTGWDITGGHQLAFNLMVAELAHERGLAIGLKNDLGQTAELADTFDFAVVEQCAEYGECNLVRPFLDRGKPVFHAEYDLPLSAFCAESRRLGLSSIRKRVDLGPWRETC